MLAVADSRAHSGEDQVAASVRAEEVAERDLDVLVAIQTSPKRVRQREIARALGMSLGMTNAIVRRLTQKGLLKIQRLNARNIQYVVSPQGVDVIARRSYRYLRRTLGNVVRYKDQVEQVLWEAQQQGFQKVAVVGASDLEFIVEHFARRIGLALARREQIGEETDTLWLLSEAQEWPLAADNETPSNVRSLGRELMELSR